MRQTDESDRLAKSKREGDLVCVKRSLHRCLSFMASAVSVTCNHLLSGKTVGRPERQPDLSNIANLPCI